MQARYAIGVGLILGSFAVIAMLAIAIVLVMQSITQMPF